MLKMFFYYTHCFKHVMRKTHVFLLSYSVLIDLHENLKGEGGGHSFNQRIIACRAQIYYRPVK